MKTDMSSDAITMRLKKTSELRKLCIALGGDRLKERLKIKNVEQLYSDRIHPPVVPPSV
jgi:hypothetical protein